MMKYAFVLLMILVLFLSACTIQLSSEPISYFEPSYECEDGTYVNSKLNCPELSNSNNNQIDSEKKQTDYWLSCPISEFYDSGRKTSDWFSCFSVTELLNKEKDEKKIDCSNKDNYDTEKINFAINTRCESDGLIYFGGNCTELGGTVTPIILSTAYPSLNEYYFTSTSIKLQNSGCTKLDMDNYKLIYGLYQNNQLVELKTGLLSDYNMFGKKYNQIYPEGMLIFSVGFGSSSLLPDPIKLPNPNNLRFKICLVDASTELVISCDKTRFNIEYDK